ncbi:MAG: FKBP-type peptidyl-prolyl cis-trans isomerase [Candidatus Nezhaarchaeales archaeon]
MPLQKGDFILIDYVAKVKDTDTVIDLTREDVAKKVKFYKPDGIYEPKLVKLDEGWLPKGLEEALLTMEVGEERTIEIPPEKAFGLRDPSNVKVLPARELVKRGITPRVGGQVELDNKTAIIRSVGGGRVTLDFNHPLAGKTIVYTVKVVSKVELDQDKVLELIHRRVPTIPKDKFKVQIEGSSLTITLPEEAFSVGDIQYAKRGLLNDIEKYLPSIEKVTYLETFTLRRSKPP